MSSWHSYPDVHNLGHAAVKDLFTVPVIIEEKVDGSQFSFGVIDGVLRVRSRGKEMVVDAPEKMFAGAVQAVKDRQHLLQPGWTYRGEVLSKPKHNVLAYSRVPNGGVILFDINTDEETYLDPTAKAQEAKRIGFECVPCIAIHYVPSPPNLEILLGYLSNVSVLGGQRIEGIVIKPLHYDLFGRDGKAIFGKFVSESFKETHKVEWRKGNPISGDILDILRRKYNSEARWQKAVLHLREQGMIEDDPRDIGKLIKEIPADVKKECEQEIKDALFAWAWPHVARACTSGMPEWYKQELLKKQFEVKDAVPIPDSNEQR